MIKILPIIYCYNVSLFDNLIENLSQDVADEIYERTCSFIISQKSLSDPIDYDEKKALMNFLWELFAGWSFADGYREEDIVKLIIEKI